MSPFVVDANVINHFQDERISGEEGPAHSALNAIMDHHFIALDDGGHCLNEWLACAAGKFPLALQDWLNDMLVLQRVRLFQFCPDSMHKELTALGLPKKDHKWVRLARGSGAPSIVTEDVDLFDPTSKKASSAQIANLKQKRSGHVAKYLRKTYKIEVMACQHVQEFCGKGCSFA